VDLKTKLNKLGEEKSALICELKALPGFSESENVITTPKRKPEKRGINTPTPRSCRQVKRQMTKTPLNKSRKVLDYEKPRYQTMILKSRYSYCILILYNNHRHSVNHSASENYYNIDEN
jgi:hypothetical protein